MIFSDQLMLAMRWIPSVSVSTERPGHTRNTRLIWAEDHKCQTSGQTSHGPEEGRRNKPSFPIPPCVSWTWCHQAAIVLGRSGSGEGIVECCSSGKGVLFIYSEYSFRSQIRENTFPSSYGVPINKNKISKPGTCLPLVIQNPGSHL